MSTLENRSNNKYSFRLKNHMQYNEEFWNQYANENESRYNEEFSKYVRDLASSLPGVQEF